MSVNSIGEDAELVVRIHRMLGDEEREGEVVFVPEPVAWTEVPETRAVLRKQRRRWHRGLAEIFLRHKSMMFRPRYGVIGTVTMPWFLVFELLAPGRRGLRPAVVRAADGAAADRASGSRSSRVWSTPRSWCCC